MTEKGDEGDPVRFWATPTSVSEHELVKGFGGVVPPVIAGFSLATIATLVSADQPPRLANWSIAGLVASASFLLYSMQFAFAALRYWSTPSDRLMWRPEATEDADVLYEERWRHALDLQLFRRYARRARVFYNVGVLAFTLSIVFLVVPPGSPARWGLDRVVVLSLASLGVLGELTLLVGQRRGWPRSLVWPSYAEVRIEVPAPATLEVPRVVMPPGSDVSKVDVPEGSLDGAKTLIDARIADLRLSVTRQRS